MLHQMCHDVLAVVDINAIRKARGFSQNETASRSTLENAFLSSTGLAHAMASLSEAEVITLHLLKNQPEPVDITFFARLYGSSEEDQYFRQTFNQKYRETLEAVKKSLVRKGLLVICEQKNHPESVQMQRWRFTLPPMFAQFLPPLLPNPHLSDAPGSLQTSIGAHKLREALGGPPVSASTVKSIYKVSLEAGTLRFGEQPFQVDLLRNWQLNTWKEDLLESELYAAGSLTPVNATCAILRTLAPGQWVTANQLATPLKIFVYSGDQPLPAKVCQAGWKWGCLARLSEGGETYYRLPQNSNEDVDAPTDFSVWLQAGPDGALLVDLEHIPLNALEQLNALTALSADQERLLATPNLAKLGQASPEVRQSQLASWLSEHVPAFQQAMEEIEQRWGKVIVHSNLLVARVRDLSLRVQIERDLRDQVVVLNEEFIAFPAAYRSIVERVLRKSGFVVKEVKA